MFHLGLLNYVRFLCYLKSKTSCIGTDSVLYNELSFLFIYCPSSIWKRFHDSPEISFLLKYP